MASPAAMLGMSPQAGSVNSPMALIAPSPSGPYEPGVNGVGTKGRKLQPSLSVDVETTTDMTEMTPTSAMSATKGKKGGSGKKGGRGKKGQAQTPAQAPPPPLPEPKDEFAIPSTPTQNHSGQGGQELHFDPSIHGNMANHQQQQQQIQQQMQQQMQAAVQQAQAQLSTPQQGQSQGMVRSNTSDSIGQYPPSSQNQQQQALPQHPPGAEQDQQNQQGAMISQAQTQSEENYGDFASLLSGFGNGTSNGGLGGDTDGLVPPSASGSAGFNLDSYGDFDFDVSVCAFDTMFGCPNCER